MLQLPPWFDFSGFRKLHNFLAGWPQESLLSVELRHPDWFDEGRRERDLHRLLVDYGAERVCLDSRALFATPASDASTTAAHSRKPQVPVRFVGLGGMPMVRIIGRNDPSECTNVLISWAKVVSRWLREGRAPLVFCHTPGRTLRAPDWPVRFTTRFGFLFLSSSLYPPGHSRPAVMTCN